MLSFAFKARLLNFLLVVPKSMKQTTEGRKEWLPQLDSNKKKQYFCCFNRMLIVVMLCFGSIFIEARRKFPYLEFIYTYVYLSVSLFVSLSSLLFSSRLYFFPNLPNIHLSFHLISFHFVSRNLLLFWVFLLRNDQIKHLSLSLSLILSPFILAVEYHHFQSL